MATQSPSTSSTFGEKMCMKAPHEYRIVSNNIGCIGIESIANSKQNSLKDWLARNEVDIVNWQEIGLAQHMI